MYIFTEYQVIHIFLKMNLQTKQQKKKLEIQREQL